MSILDRLSELEAAATAEPWEDYDRALVVTDREWMKPPTRRLAVADCGYSESPHRDADAALIANSRNHLRALIMVARAADRLASYKRPFYGEAFTELQAALVLLTEETPSDPEWRFEQEC